MMLEAFTVTVSQACAETRVSLYEGAAKVFACQSFIKKPMVGARGGSTAGAIVMEVSVVPPPDEVVPEAFFEQLWQTGARRKIARPKPKGY